MEKSGKAAKDLLVQVLGIDAEAATILVENGFRTLEEVAYVPFSELVSIKDLQEAQLQLWRQRARNHLLVQATNDGDEGEPQSSAALPPLKPIAGGASAQLDDSE